MRLTPAIVRFVTADKTVQAVMTGATFAVFQYWAVVLAGGVTALPGVGVPRAVVVLVVMHGVVAVAYWADRHTEAWRELVEGAAEGGE